jgi:hypothetical protein
MLESYGMCWVPGTKVLLVGIIEFAFGRTMNVSQASIVRVPS